MLITLSDSSDILKSEKGIIRGFIDIKRKVSLYYSQITIGLQSGYNHLHHLLHLESSSLKKKKSRRRKQKTKEKDRMKGKRKKGKR